MKTRSRGRALCLLILLAPFLSGAQRVVQFERISAYHHIQVYDENGKRTLSFNGSWETTMSLTNPLTGHFEYTEYFQMPWLWNHDIKRVLMERYSMTGSYRKLSAQARAHFGRFGGYALARSTCAESASAGGFQ